jgi:hypothetical protein
MNLRKLFKNTFQIKSLTFKNLIKKATKILKIISLKTDTLKSWIVLMKINKSYMNNKNNKKMIQIKNTSMKCLKDI